MIYAVQDHAIPKVCKFKMQPKELLFRMQFNSQSLYMIYDIPTMVQFINAPYMNDYFPLSCFSCLCCYWILGCAGIVYVLIGEDLGTEKYLAQKYIH